jgi:hypothetical protein
LFFNWPDCFASVVGRMMPNISSLTSTKIFTF